MNNSHKVTGIILSGGKSSRMGTEKGLVRYKGKALVEYSLEALRPVCDQIVISSGNDNYDYLNLPVVSDEIENCGPVGGIYSCMKAIPSDVYFVVSCDVPHISSMLFSDLINLLGQNQAVIPIDSEGRKQPLAACYTARCFSIFEKELLENRLKMMKLLSKLKVQYYPIAEKTSAYPANLFFNANTPDDLTFL